MIAFAGKAADTIDFSQGRPAIRSWLLASSSADAFYKNLGENGRLFDSISASLKLLEPFQIGDALYVITNGKVTRSRSR
jgi:hypothetical protein